MGTGGGGGGRLDEGELKGVPQPAGPPRGTAGSKGELSRSRLYMCVLAGAMGAERKR
jgi:hypothetical protein